MATYKVIQDIEAEDKLLGPLTLKQFIFAGIAATCMYFNVIALTRGAAFLLVFLVPPMLFTGFMAWPWSKDQPTEVWLIAKLRFFFKPRRRIWDQSGLKQLVTITAPKRVDKIYTDNMSQTDVKSRLEALANTIDSRGWAVKNVNVNLFAQANYVEPASDRLIDPMSLPREVSNVDVVAADDILDEQNNSTAHHLDQMINSSSQAHHQALVAQMQAGSSPANGAGQGAVTTRGNQPQATDWFVDQPGQPTTLSQTDEQALSVSLHQQAAQPAQAQSHLRNIQPAGASSPQPAAATSTPTSDPAIINLAHNDDLDVATIAREAHKSTAKQSPDDEVVVPLR